jgi:UDP-N-acetyl-D-mannosaminuronate dehydrogenase
MEQYCNSNNNNDIITTETTQQQSIFIFGLGYVGCSLANSLINKGWKVSGTCTNVKKIQMLNNQGIKAYLFDDYVGKLETNLEILKQKCRGKKVAFHGVCNSLNNILSWSNLKIDFINRNC